MQSSTSSKPANSTRNNRYAPQIDEDMRVQVDKPVTAPPQQQAAAPARKQRGMS